jgi:MFS family permease
MPAGEWDRSLAPFVLLEGATLLSAAGNGAAEVVLPWLVLERTGSAGAAGLLAAATAVPLLAVSVFSGTVVDTIGRRRASVGSDVLSAASVAAIPILDRFVGLHLGSLILLAVIGAAFDPTGITARETMLPEAAERAGWSLDRVNGVHEAMWGGAYLIGPGLGGVLIAWIGAVDALWVTAVGFVASAAMVGAMRLDLVGRPDEADQPTGIWHGTREGIAFVWNDRLLRAIALLAAALVAAYMPIEGVLLPVHFEAIRQPGRLGAVVMAMSAGGMVGSLAYGALAGRRRRSLVFRLALALTGVFVLGLAFLPPFGVMLVASLGIGLAYGPIGPIVNLAMQTRTPERLRGRVVGIITSADYAAGPVGFLLVGAAVSRWDVEPVFVAVGALVLLVAASGLVVRSLRDLDDLDGGDQQPGAVALVDTTIRGPVPIGRSGPDAG